MNVYVITEVRRLALGYGDLVALARVTVIVKCACAVASTEYSYVKIQYFYCIFVDGLR